MNAEPVEAVAPGELQEAGAETAPGASQEPAAAMPAPAADTVLATIVAFFLDRPRQWLTNKQITGATGLSLGTVTRYTKELTEQRSDIQVKRAGREKSYMYAPKPGLGLLPSTPLTAVELPPDETFTRLRNAHSSDGHKIAVGADGQAYKLVPIA